VSRLIQAGDSAIRPDMGTVGGLGEFGRCSGFAMYLRIVAGASRAMDSDLAATAANGSTVSALL
jgi:hypothetical protein